MSDDEHDAQRELDLARGTAMMGARNWSEEDKLASFMAIFHPDHETPKAGPRGERDSRGRPGAAR